MYVPTFNLYKYLGCDLSVYFSYSEEADGYFEVKNFFLILIFSYYLLLINVQYVVFVCLL